MACPLAAVYWETGVEDGIALLGTSRFPPGDDVAHLRGGGVAENVFHAQRTN